MEAKDIIPVTLGGAFLIWFFFQCKPKKSPEELPIQVIGTYQTEEEKTRHDKANDRYYSGSRESTTIEKKEITNVLIINKKGDLEVKTYDGRWTLGQVRKIEEDED